jgi:hypothetical protein
MAYTPLIVAVKDVTKSSIWYHELLGLAIQIRDEHFINLIDEKGTVNLSFQRAHPRMTNPNTDVGFGQAVFITVPSLLTIRQNTLRLQLEIEHPPHHNPETGCDQFVVKDLDGYFVIIEQIVPLA